MMIMVESNPIETLLYQSDGQSTEINVIFDYENETLCMGNTKNNG